MPATLIDGHFNRTMPPSNSAHDVYDRVTAMVDQSIAAIHGDPSDANQSKDLDEAIHTAKALLEGFRDRTIEAIEELRDFAEWDTFTIAFYGETNAGKSTLIETLRILLGDPEKLARQEEFRTLARHLHIDPDSTAALAHSIQTLTLQLAESHARTQLLTKKWHLDELQRGKQLDALNATLEHRRNKLSLWQKVVRLFRKLDEEKAVTDHQLQTVERTAAHEAALAALSESARDIGKSLTAKLGDQARAEDAFTQLEPLQDGSIIGNGRSDFTLRANTYRFVARGQKFQLIDVPGIEGAETKVMGAIEVSVKKAHAVFFVTRAATPPGSGSDGQEGTIDKIRRQLGRQTEVWAIYNKSATNPQVLRAETLITPNDAIGLRDMSKALVGTLGTDTFKGHVCVSGMPAFLASAECLVPGSVHARSREKFLAAWSVDEILKRSGMDAFLTFIRDEICQNFQKKIRDANLKKVRSVLEEGIDRLHAARNSFRNAAMKLQVQNESASTQLDALRLSTSQKLRSELRDELQRKQVDLRKAIYQEIEEDRSNEAFKTCLISAIGELKDNVGTDLEARFARVMETFQREASDIITRNQRNVDEILDHTVDRPFASMRVSFAAEFRMDSGISVAGVLTTLGGAAVLVWSTFLVANPVGLTAAVVIGAIGLVFSFYKSVRSGFSSAYKKEQQRKAADDNLRDIFEKLLGMLDTNLQSASAGIKEALEISKAQMLIPHQRSVGIALALQGVATQMMGLRDTLTSSRTVPTANYETAAAAAVAEAV